MKVTVCELSDDEFNFLHDWNQLVVYLNHHKTELLLLPEMPFCKWIATRKDVSMESKLRSVEQHEMWISRLEQLNVKQVVYSKPVLVDGQFFNTAFVFQKNVGHSKIHTKSFFPEEPFFWEETLYDHERVRKFEVLDLGELKIGVLLCTEMWFMEYARQYAKQGVDILLCPRATGIGSVDQWIKCGQMLSILSGAYCLSSNKSGPGENGFHWGGNGWIAEPKTGAMLGITTSKEKFITIEIDLTKSRSAKYEYPLYVKE